MLALLLILAVIDVWLIWHCIELREACAHAEREQCRLNASIEQARQEQAELEYRLHWTSAVARGDSPLRVALGSQPSSEETPPLALWVRLRGKRAAIADACGLDEEALRQVRLDAVQLGQWSDPVLGHDDLRTGSIVRLPPSLVARIRQLHVLRVNTTDGTTSLLLLSHLPAITGDLARDRVLIHRLAAEFPPRSAQAEQGPDEDEIRLVRDMLELRSLTDLDFHSPMELLAEFLSRISLTCGYDRGALYLLNRDQLTPQLELIAQGGKAMRRSTYDTWLLAEQRFLRQHAGQREVVLLTPDVIAQVSEPNPFHSGLILPLLHGSDLFGHLVFTGSQKSQPVASDLQLSRWGAEYLVATIVRTLDRVAVEDQARRDPLTRLANRHAFDTVLRRCVGDAGQPDADPCSLILLDLDRFKSINDTYGHLAGDAVLRHAAQVVTSVSNSRVTDRPLVARYGGEEIAVLLPNVGEAGALRIAEAIREGIEHSPVNHDGRTIAVTTSAGVAISSPGMTPESLIAAADAALYRAKRLGRNRVELASEVHPTP